MEHLEPMWKLGKPDHCHPQWITTTFISILPFGVKYKTKHILEEYLNGSGVGHLG